ncbi:MAG: DUF4340 domain-containing protein [Candidatus Aminicenantales bacterium]
MKTKTTLILFIIFIGLLAFVYFFEVREKAEKETEEKLVDLSSDDVEKIIFKKKNEEITFQKDGEDWLIIQPLEAKADKYEVNRLADDFSQLRMERVVEEQPEDLTKYGIGTKEVSLFFKGREKPIKILVGEENPLDRTFFAKREDEKRVVLIPSHLKNLLEKSLFDFRMKDVFRFETDDVKGIRLRTNDLSWRAVKKKDDWLLKKPVEALAESSRISDILYSLSNLRAKEFVSEEKKQEEIKRYGLDRPDYEIILEMPLENKEVTFCLKKIEDKLYATTSLSSKIIAAEDSILKDLEKKPEELREKEVADFYSWKVNRIHLRNADMDWTLIKDKQDNWHFEHPVKKDAAKDKVESFIRKIESLEATEFVDPPLELKEYGLDHPQAYVKFWVEEDEEKAREIMVLIGKENKEEKKIVVKNARFDYLFKVDSSFLEEFPKSLKDWMEENKEDKKKK